MQSKEKKSFLWVGGRLKWKESNSSSVTLRLYGQGKSLSIKQKKTQLFYKTCLALEPQDLVAFKLNQKKVTLKNASEAFTQVLGGVQAFFHANKNASFKQKKICQNREKNFNSYQNLFFGPERAKRWNYFIESIRSYFNRKNFIEIQTPSLVKSPCTETNLEAFSLQFRWNSLKKKFFLPTSPELHLKKLLCQDWTDIFEIRPCFRNGELSSVHEPEFWMLEWYRGFSDLKQIERDLKDLLSFLKKSGLILTSLPPLKRISLKELFKKYLQFSLTPSTSFGELEKKAKEMKIRVLKGYDWDDLFHLLFLSKIEPQLKKGAYLIYDFPPDSFTLNTPNKEGWSSRFEFYWEGLEIANAFDELRGLQEHKKKWKKASLVRKKRGWQKIPMDHNFFTSLQAGMPPSGGIALGLDRLFLASQGLSQIREIRPFTLRDQF